MPFSKDGDFKCKEASRQSTKASPGIQITTMVIGAVVCIIGPLWWLAQSWKWIQQVRQGPRPITVEQLRTLEDPTTLPTQYVILPPADSVADSGIVRMVKTRGYQMEEKNFLIKVGDRIFIAIVKPKTPVQAVLAASNPVLIGYLCDQRLVGNSDKEIRDMVLAAHPNEKFYPYMIDLADQTELANVRLWGIVLVVMLGLYLEWDACKKMQS